MAKVKKSWFCKNCGSESPKWLGRCPDCGEWNTFVEEVVAKESTRRYGAGEVSRAERSQPVLLSPVREQNLERIDMGYPEVNRVLGGGLVPGSLVLLGGEPGIGKSTLSLQLAMRAGGLDVLYVSGEESPEQIKIRADRLGDLSESCYILAETSCEQIVDRMRSMRPGMVVIDSIQTLYSDTVESSPGSISQIRECAAILMRYAKETMTPLFIIGHITKDGAIAGPKILEHIVDVVLQFEGDPNNIYRLLRSIKNRFGATSEIGVFEMRSEGLVEVPNPASRRTPQRHSHRRHHGRGPSLSDRGAGSRLRHRLRYAATHHNRIRRQAFEYAFSRHREAAQLPDGLQRCISKHSRRLQGKRPRSRRRSRGLHIILRPRQTHTRRHRFRRRDRLVGRGAPRHPHGTTHNRGFASRFQTDSRIGIRT